MIDAQGDGTCFTAALPSARRDFVGERVPRYATPTGLKWGRATVTRGSRCAATPGYLTEALRAKRLARFDAVPLVGIGVECPKPQRGFVGERVRRSATPSGLKWGWGLVTRGSRCAATPGYHTKALRANEPAFFGASRSSIADRRCRQVAGGQRPAVAMASKSRGPLAPGYCDERNDLTSWRTSSPAKRLT
jgi:hypothetical protein